jgi:cobalt/nickel transport system ATP-binding protein
MNVQSISQNNSFHSEESILEVRDVSFRYSRKHPLVLNNISVNFSKNRLTVIAGPNGSGKTTLMKHFNGSLVSLHGEITVFGEKIRKKNRRLIQQLVGLVFQNPDEQIFFPKVYDDVAFGPKNMKLPWEDVKNRVDKALKEVQIYDLKDRITFNLSFGEKKRLAFAGILAMQPKIIVLDEPTISIDPWSKPRMINVIDSLKKNRTVIVITHDFELMEIADRILLLKDGQIKGDFTSFDDFYQQEFQNGKS